MKQNNLVFLKIMAKSESHYKQLVKGAGKNVSLEWFAGYGVTLKEWVKWSEKLFLNLSLNSSLPRTLGGFKDQEFSKARVYKDM